MRLPKRPRGLSLGVFVGRQAVQVGPVMLRRARLGGQYGRIQGKRAEGAIVTRRPLWVCMTRAVAAEIAGYLL